MVLEQIPSIWAPWAKQPSARRSYPDSVERWRSDVGLMMPEALKQRPDAERLVDKMLHVFNFESGGDPSAVGDGGIAHGLAQSHYISADSSPQQQIADAWRLVANNPDQWTDWGEGATYEGKPFGALGNVPYDSTPAGPGANGGSAGSVATLGAPARTTGVQGMAARVVQQRMDKEKARQATTDEDARARLETILSRPLIALPHEREASQISPPDVGDEGLAAEGGAAGALTGRLFGARDSASGGSGFAPGVTSGMGGGGNYNPGTQELGLTSGGIARPVLGGALKAADAIGNVGVFDVTPGGKGVQALTRAAGLGSGPKLGDELPGSAAVAGAIENVPSANLLGRAGIHSIAGVELPDAGSVLAQAVPRTYADVGASAIGARSLDEAILGVRLLNKTGGLMRIPGTARSSLDIAKRQAAEALGPVIQAAERAPPELVGGLAANGAGGIQRAALGDGTDNAYGAIVRDATQRKLGPEGAAKVESGLIKSGMTWAEYGDNVKAFDATQAPWERAPGTGSATAFRGDPNNPEDVASYVRSEVQASRAEKAGEGTRGAMQRARTAVGGEGSMLGKDARQLRTGAQNPVQPDDIAFGDRPTAAVERMKAVGQSRDSRLPIEQRRLHILSDEALQSQLRETSDQLAKEADPGNQLKLKAMQDQLVEEARSRPTTQWMVGPSAGEGPSRPVTTLAGARSANVEEAQATFASEAQRARDLGDAAKSARRAGIVQQAKRGIDRIRDAIVGEPELPGIVPRMPGRNRAPRERLPSPDDITFAGEPGQPTLDELGKKHGIDLSAWKSADAKRRVLGFKLDELRQANPELPPKIGDQYKYQIGDTELSVSNVGHTEKDGPQIYEFSVVRDTAGEASESFQGRAAGSDLESLRQSGEIINKLRAENPGAIFVSSPTDERRARIYERVGWRKPTAVELAMPGFPNPAGVGYGTLVLDKGIDSRALSARPAIGGEGSMLGVSATGRRALERTGEEAAGAPPGIVSKQHYDALIDRLTENAKVNEADRFWYEASSKAINDVAKGNPQDAELMARLFAVGSVQTNVRDQAMYTLRNWANIKAGNALSNAHRFPNAVGKMLDDAVSMSNAEWDAKIIDNIKAGRSEKLNNFYLDFLDGIDPARAAKLREASGATVTVDQWMNRAFGYASDARTPAQYRFMAEATKRVADRLGWTPKQAQAAIWIHEIIDAGQASADEASVTIADSLARHKTQLFNEVVPAPGSPRFAVVGEALPNARSEQLAEHAKLIDSAMRDEDGYDIIGKAVDLPVEPVHGNPLIGPAPGGESIGAVGPEQLPKLQIYAEARAMALGQAEGSWLRRFTIKSAGQHNAQWLDIGRTATHDELEALRNALPDLVVKPTDSGAAIFRVPDEADYASRASGKADAAVTKLNKDNQRAVIDAVNGVWENTDIAPKLESFAADGGRVALNGEGSALGAALNDSPALREAIDRVRQRVAVADSALASGVSAPERTALPEAGSLFTRTGSDIPGPSAVPGSAVPARQPASDATGPKGFFGRTEGIPEFADPLNPTAAEIDSVREALLAEANRLDQTGVSNPIRSTIGDVATLAKRLGDPGSEIRRQLQQNGIIGGEGSATDNRRNQPSGPPETRQLELGDLKEGAAKSQAVRLAEVRDAAKANSKNGGSVGSTVAGIFGAPRSLALSADSGLARDLSILSAHPKALSAGATGARANLTAYMSDEAASTAQTWVKEHPWYDFTTSRQNFDRPFHVYEYGGGVPSDLRVPEMSGLNESAVSRVVGDLPWVKMSDRALATGRNVAGMELLGRRAEELGQLYGKDSVRFYREMQSTIDWVNHVRGFSGGDTAKKLGALNFLTSPQQLISRLQLVADPLSFAARGDYASARYAAENLLGFAATQASYLTLLKLTAHSAGDAWSVELDPTSTDFGQVKIGNTRFDALAGLGPLIKLVGRITAAGSDSFLGTDLAPNDQAEIGTLVQRWFENKENPVSGIISDYIFHNKLPDEQTAIDSLVPSLVTGIADVLKNGGGPGLAAGAAAANFGGIGTTSYKSADDLKREGTEDAFPGKRYDELDDVQKIRVLANLPKDAPKNAKTQERQKYDDLLKQKGYLEAPPKNADGTPGETDSEKRKRVARNDDVKESLDTGQQVQRWYWEGGTTLPSKDAVDKALELKVPDREVKLSGTQRDLTTDQGKQFWQNNGKAIAPYFDDDFVAKTNKALADYYGGRSDEKLPYDQLSPEKQKTVAGNVRQAVREQDAGLDALLAYIGVGTNKRYTVHSEAAAEQLAKLRAKYGSEPAQEDYKFYKPDPTKKVGSVPVDAEKARPAGTR